MNNPPLTQEQVVTVLWYCIEQLQSGTSTNQEVALMLTSLANEFTGDDNDTIAN